MDLQQIDVGQAQPLQACIDTFEDVLPAEAVLVHVSGSVAILLALQHRCRIGTVSDRGAELGGDDDGIAPPVVFLNGFS